MLYYGPDDPRNTLPEPLAPGKSVAIFGSAVNFTRYFGTTFADQPLEIVSAFSNEEVVLVPAEHQVESVNPMTGLPVIADRRLPEEIRGVFPVIGSVREVTDEDLPDLHYDGIAQSTGYKPGETIKVAKDFVKPAKPPVGDKGLVTIYGSALCVLVANVGNGPAEQLRVFVRGSVF